MINTREFRIGNLLIEKNSGQIIEVINISQNRISFSGQFKAGWQAEPIPLTEELLITFGAIWNESIKHFTLNWGRNGVLFIKKCPEYGEGFFGIQLGDHKYKIINHVHRFQNLCFELTEQELKLNDK